MGVGRGYAASPRKPRIAEPIREGRAALDPVRRDRTEVCRTHPGFDEDLIVTADSAFFAERHLGRIEWGRRARRWQDHRGGASVARARPADLEPAERLGSQLGRLAQLVRALA
jgi:hypothetical protein